VEVKFKKFDKKRTIEAQLMDLINDLKAIGIKIIENSKYQNGYGEGVCLILTQLLDKYLINQNFIFNKPIFNEGNEENKDNYELDEVILEDNNFNYLNVNNNKSNNQIDKITNNNFYNISNTKNRNMGLGFSNSKRFHSGKSTTTQGKIYLSQIKSLFEKY